MTFTETTRPHSTIRYLLFMQTGNWNKDPRSAQALWSFHQRVRSRTPFLQAVAFVLLVPFFAVISRLRVKTEGTLPKGPYIAVANHPSTLDPFFVAIALRRRIHFMGKSELFAGTFGRLLAGLGAFPVRRGVWDKEAFATAEHVLEKGHVMAMFLEGGISPQHETRRWANNRLTRLFNRKRADAERAQRMQYRSAKAGVGHLAHRTGVPIVPIHIAGTRALYKPWTWVRVTVHVGEPVHYEKLDEADRAREQNTADELLEQITALPNISS